MERAKGSDPTAAPHRPSPRAARLGFSRSASVRGWRRSPPSSRAIRLDFSRSPAQLRVLACALLGTAGLLSAACTGHRKPATLPDSGEVVQRGHASWYGAKFDGKRTASGERYDMHALTAAHPSFPFGTLVKVTNVENGRQVVVRINDRGPFSRRRIIDVSYAAAKELELVGPGTARVELAVVREEVRPEPVEPLPSAGVAVADLSVSAGGPAASLTYVPVPSPEAREAGDALQAPSTAAGAPHPADPPTPPAFPRAGTPRTARPVGSLRYTVQVGAFGERERADALQQQLAGRYPQAAVRSDGIWNRVQVGLFATRDDAESLRHELAESGLEALVTTAPDL